MCERARKKKGRCVFFNPFSLLKGLKQPKIAQTCAVDGVRHADCMRSVCERRAVVVWTACGRVRTTCDGRRVDGRTAPTIIGF